jgi:hypothetical protein
MCTRVFEITLKKTHKKVSRTKNIAYGKLIKRPNKLVICSYTGDTGYYLMQYSEDDLELIDTYHDSIEEAMEQAEWEYDIKPYEWLVPK